MPIYKSARGRRRTARVAAKQGVATPNMVYRTLVANICKRRRCEDRDREPGDRVSIELLPAGVASLEPWEWPPSALAAVARDLRATTGRVVDDDSFFKALRWLCDQRADGCSGERLRGESGTRYEAYSETHSVEFSVSAWDWPRTVGVDISNQLYAGRAPQFRREKAANLSRKSAAATRAARHSRARCRRSAARAGRVVHVQAAHRVLFSVPFARSRCEVRSLPRRRIPFGAPSTRWRRSRDSHRSIPTQAEGGARRVCRAGGLQLLNSTPAAGRFLREVL